MIRIVVALLCVGASADITLFTTTARYTGDFGNRSVANALCAARGVCPSNNYALASYTGDLAVNLPAPAGEAVYSLINIQLGTNFSDVWNLGVPIAIADIAVSLGAETDRVHWMGGHDVFGTPSNNCDDFTNASATVRTWPLNLDEPCGVPKFVACFCF